MIQDFIALFFPNYCISCHGGLLKEEKYICTYCRSALPKTDLHKGADDPLIQRLRGMVSIDHFFAYLKFSKKGKVQKIINKLKYEDCPEIGIMMGEWYGAVLQEAGFSQAFDLILPVPLHKSKFIKRGYNQSDYFAEGLSKSLGIGWNAKTLHRKVKNQSQTRKGRIERFENVSGIFEVSDFESVKDKRILLVDDVITTGATLFAAANPLIEAKCRSISIAALAITQ